MAAAAGYSMDISSAASATATGGTAGGGSGSFIVNNSKTVVPQWVWIAAAVLAGIFLWRTTGRNR